VAAVATSLLLEPGPAARRIAHARNQALHSSGDGILVVDSEGRILEAHGEPVDALMDAFGASAERLPRLPRAIADGLSRGDPGPLRVKAGAVHVLEIWSQQCVGSEPRGAPSGLLVRDITRQRRNEQSLIRLAHYDSLTGLPNRRLFLRTLKNELETARESDESCALFYLDLDRFKEVNDTFGHGAGDELLQEMSRRFLEQLRPERFDGSTLAPGARIHLGRLSGDEFAVIASKIPDPEAAREVAHRIQKAFDEPVKVAERAITSSASIGIAVFPRDGEDVDGLIHAADAAVYAAKNGGRGRSTFYEPSATAEQEKLSRIAQALARAIERGELRLDYQPKVCVSSGTAVGFEALLRWDCNELGTVGPGDFIPIAEERGLIKEIGAWCLNEACRQIGRWREEGLTPVPIAVNVSSVQFRDDDLQRTVTEALKTWAVEPELIQIELTESLLLAEGDSTATCLRDLRAIGVAIALDDFGTGYSALAYLNLFPLDVLKLDRAFLREIHLDRSAARIVSAVVAMAHGLGLTVVAEGVDSEEQVPVLREMGCDQIQGFLYAPALSADAASLLLAHSGTGKLAPVVPFAAGSLGRLPAGALSREATAVVTHPSVDPSFHGPVDGGLLLVDDGSATLQPLAARLLGLGTRGLDLHYASNPEEALLLVAQESTKPLALAVPPTLDASAIASVREQMAAKLPVPPPLVVIGDEPNTEARHSLRALSHTSVLWSPFDDVELVFILKSALSPMQQVSRRTDVRVPLNLTTRLQAGQRRETLVLSSLSPHGAFVEMSDPPPLGAELRLDFDLATDSFRLFARVLYHAQEDPDRPFSNSGMGVAFFGLERKVELRLVRAVEECAARYVP
jgi:diguanylate cyclase (GGDEF)-like protein